MTPAERLGRARGLLLDLDGTLLAGDRPAPGALALVAAWAGRIAVVSNYSTMSAENMAGYLATMGLAIPSDRLCLAGELALDTVARLRPGARTLCLLTDEMTALAARRGLVPSEDRVEVVLLGRDLGFDYRRLALSIRALHAGAALFVTNLDPAHPDAAGVPVPETGALLAAMLAACPRAEPRVIGKPQPELFRKALARLGLSPHEALMIGDSPQADLEGARAAGIACLLVGRAAGAVAPDLAGLGALARHPDPAACPVDPASR